MNFLKNDLTSRSGQFHDTLFRRDRYQGQSSGSRHRLIVIHTHDVETSIRQPVTEDPRTSKSIDHIIEEQQNIEQPIEHPIGQQVSHEETTLRRSTKVRNLARHNYYTMYLNYNIGVEHDLQMFSHAMSLKESNL